MVGRSNNVGKPGLWLGLERNATVVSCDHHTYAAGKLSHYTRQADVLIVAAGVSCRQQIKHGTGRRALHPAEVLRRALVG